MLLLKEDKKITDEDIIEKIISSKGSIADKIGMLIRARRDNHGNEAIQNKCNKALDWLYDNKDIYNVDLDNVLVAGESAGSYYIAMLAELKNNPEKMEKIGVSSKYINIINISYGLQEDLGEQLQNKILE